jgi:PKHD-type hydroxylase
MQLQNTYYYFKSALSPEQCKKIVDVGLEKIQFLKNKGESTAGTTAGNTHKQAKTDSIPQSEKTVEELSKQIGKSEQEIHKESYVRDSEICWLNDNWLYNMVNPFLEQANKNSGWGFEYTSAEDFQFTVYKPGGFYGWHADGQSDNFGVYKRLIPGVTPNTSQYIKIEKNIGKVRKLSMTINLNAPGEYDGGNLKFDFGPHFTGKRFHECEEIRPQGSLIVFPSFIYHQVTPITRGTRYSLVLWILGKPFK